LPLRIRKERFLKTRYLEYRNKNNNIELFLDEYKLKES